MVTAKDMHVAAGAFCALQNRDGKIEPIDALQLRNFADQLNASATAPIGMQSNHPAVDWLAVARRSEQGAAHATGPEIRTFVRQQADLINHVAEGTADAATRKGAAAFCLRMHHAAYQANKAALA